MGLFDRAMPGRFCQVCDVLWPSTVRYVRCPGCKAFTSVIKSNRAPLTEHQAERKVSAMHFEQFLEQRGAEARDETLRINAAFEAAIEQGGWTQWEKNQIERLEAQLPPAPKNDPV